eukprot:scaffold56161_cov39-Tisochrysis_lutea.AAC.1
MPDAGSVVGASRIHKNYCTISDDRSNAVCGRFKYVSSLQTQPIHKLTLYSLVSCVFPRPSRPGSSYPFPPRLPPQCQCPTPVTPCPVMLPCAAPVMC